MNTLREMLIEQIAPRLRFGTDRGSQNPDVFPDLHALPSALCDEETLYRLASIMGLAELRLGMLDGGIDVCGSMPEDYLRDGIDEAMRLAALFATSCGLGAVRDFRARLENMTDARLHALTLAALRSREALLGECGCDEDFVLTHGWCAGFFHDLVPSSKRIGLLAEILPSVSAVAPTALEFLMPATAAVVRHSGGL